VIFLIVAAISILFILFMALRGSYNDSIIINVLGRQRMITQVIAKDINRIYELNNAMEEVSSNLGTPDELKLKLEYTKKDLQNFKEEYDKEFNDISKGYIFYGIKKLNFSGVLGTLNPTINDNRKMWGKFKTYIEVVLEQKSNTAALAEAVKYTNENNETLLGYSNEITEIVVDYNKNRSMVMIYVSIAIAILAFVLSGIFFFNIYYYLFVPINQLYKGMAEVGITGMDAIPARIEKKELTPVFSEVQGIFEKFNSLIHLIENLNKDITFKEVLEYIYKSFLPYIPYTYIGVALIGDDGNTIRASYGAAGKYHKNLAQKLLGYETKIKSTSLDSIIETGKVRVINDLEDYVQGKPLKEYNKVLLEEGIRSSITFPLKNNNKTAGIIFFSSNTKNVYKKEHIEFLKILANSIVLCLEKSIFVDDMVVGSVQALASLAEQRDSETGEHINRMSTYSKVITELLSKNKKYSYIIDIDYISDIKRFSPLHDIGKVGIRDDILLKPGKLTADEFQIMKTHTLYGAWVLKAAEEHIQKRGRSIFKLGIEIAEGHHERWDGTGYPHGKSGENIPLSARIVAAADVFDALTSKRPYKEAFTFEESCKIIVDGSGKHFDPDISAIFVEHRDTIREIYEDFKSKPIL